MGIPAWSGWCCHHPLVILFRRLLVLAALLALSGCSHESDETVALDHGAGGGVLARRALGAIDAADSCAALRLAWDEYLDTATRASVAQLVPCTRRLLATRHVVLEVRPYEAHYGELPEEISGDVHWVLLEPSDRGEADSFPLSDLLDDGWFVVTRDGQSSLHNLAIVKLDECLATKDQCSMAG